MQYFRTFVPATALLLVVASTARAQVAITPMVGGYVPASDVNQISGSATNIAKTRDGTLSLGGEHRFRPLTR